jgi:hypothetical protein
MAPILRNSCAEMERLEALHAVCARGAAARIIGASDRVHSFGSEPVGDEDRAVLTEIPVSTLAIINPRSIDFIRVKRLEQPVRCSVSVQCTSYDVWLSTHPEDEVSSSVRCPYQSYRTVLRVYKWGGRRGLPEQTPCPRHYAKLVEAARLLKVRMTGDWEITK